jgi:predicted molibdopterin-dependent oxidoreductase YjgC
MSNVSAPSDTITFYFDGAESRAMPGQSVGAALLDNGYRVLRQTRFAGKPRGMFCGIGICFDCLVVIDGIANQRACLAEVKAGMRVETQIASGSYPIRNES